MKDLFIYFFVSIFCSFNSVCIFGILTKKKPLFSFINFLFIILFSTIACLFKDIAVIKTVYSFILFLILNCLFYRETIFCKFYYTFVIWLLLMVFDLLGVLIVGLINKSFMSNLLILYFSSFVIQVLANLFARIKLVSKFYFKIYKFLFKNYYYVSIIMVVFVAYLGVMCVNSDSVNNIILIIIMLFLTILLIILIMIIYFMNNNQKELLDNFGYNIEYYVRVLANNKVFKHNLKNKLGTIFSVSDMTTKPLITDLISEVCNLSESKLEYDSLPIGINGFIQNKISILDEDVVLNVNNSIESDLLKKLTVKTYNNFCSYIGVALDNAIESVLNSNNKILSIILFEDNDKVYFSISNTFNNEIDFSSLGKISYSTKGYNRGFGLFSILNNKSINSKVSINNNVFTVNISALKNNS